MNETFKDGDFNLPDNWTEKSVLKAALKRHMKDKGVKVKSTHEDVLKYIVDEIEETFLQEVIDRKQDFMNCIDEQYNKKKALIDNAATALKKAELQMNWTKRDIEESKKILDNLKETQKTIEDKIKELCNFEIVETDPILAGAKKAYTWIYKMTNDKDAAKKAFNSYLLGGRATPNETFSEKVDDAEKAILEAESLSIY